MNPSPAPGVARMPTELEAIRERDACWTENFDGWLQLVANDRRALLAMVDERDRALSILERDVAHNAASFLKEQESVVELREALRNVADWLDEVLEYMDDAPKNVGPMARESLRNARKLLGEAR